MKSLLDIEEDAAERLRISRERRRATRRRRRTFIIVAILVLAAAIVAVLNAIQHL